MFSDYDVQLNKGKAKVENSFTHDTVTMFVWVYITNNKTDSAVEFENPGSKESLVLKLTPTVSFEQSQ